MMRRPIAFFAGMLMAGAAAAQAPASAPLAVDPAVMPPPEPENILHLDLSTGGRVTIAMRPDKAPRHVERVKILARQGFYDGTVFHRVIEGFMAQGGDPSGTGEGGSKLPNLKAEFNDLPHLRGAVAAARTGEPDTANSQFYIVLQPALKLDGTYTVWGRVIDGMAWADKIARGEPPAAPSKILKASIGSDNVTPPVFPVAITPGATITVTETVTKTEPTQK